jgi:hypothetical protein
MWPFKKKRSAADIAIEWTPRAIDVAKQQWLEFEDQPFAMAMPLDEKLFLFNEGLKSGLRQWEAFQDSPDALFLLIAAKGVERSRTHLRIEIETALKTPIPLPHERTDEEENQILMAKLIEQISRKWAYFSKTLVFNDDVSLRVRIDAFRLPLLEEVRIDFPMFREAEDNFFDPLIALGIEKSGTNSISELENALRLKL